MKYYIDNWRYIIEIDLNREIVIIEDLSGLKLSKKLLLNINNDLLDNTDKIKEKIEMFLSYNFNEEKTIKMLKLSIEDNESHKDVLEIWTLDIEDYWLYYTKLVLEELGIKIPYCFIWWQILRFYWLSRMTIDTDILILANNSDMDSIINNLIKKWIKIEHKNIDNWSSDPTLSEV